MDKMTVIVIVLAILALVFIAFFAVFRNKGKGKIKGPFGMGIQVEGVNDPPPATGVRIKDAQAGGDILADNKGAGGVDLEKVKAARNITATNAPSQGQSPPKARPPSR
jgi:hypothetical protein